MLTAEPKDNGDETVGVWSLHNVQTTATFPENPDKTVGVFQNFSPKQPNLHNENKQMILTVGAYEQDNNTLNGKEPIEWLAFAKEGNDVLAISRYALDCLPFNMGNTPVTWATCTLQEWLNSTFINAAFSSKEQTVIKSANIEAEKNPNCCTNPGNGTKDKIFLLSIDDANKYFDSNTARMCVPTAYAKAKGAYTNFSGSTDGKSGCFWRLRTPGRKENNATRVNYDGSVYNNGDCVNCVDNCICPGMWINLES